jgi:hypothetical protein
MEVNRLLNKLFMEMFIICLIKKGVKMKKYVKNDINVNEEIINEVENVSEEVINEVENEEVINEKLENEVNEVNLYRKFIDVMGERESNSFNGKVEEFILKYDLMSGKDVDYLNKLKEIIESEKSFVKISDKRIEIILNKVRKDSKLRNMYDRKLLKEVKESYLFDFKLGVLKVLLGEGEEVSGEIGNIVNLSFGKFMKRNLKSMFKVS